MTTTRQTPSFTMTTGHAGFRAAVILGLCAALIAGFLATSARASSLTVAPDTMACRVAPDGRTAC